MILVTGASGFAGRHAVAELLARGHAVRAAVRRESDHVAAGAERAVVAELATMEWTHVLDGVTCILHLAGRAHVDPGRDAGLQQAFHRVNVVATERLAQAALQHGVARFVFVSSIGVHGSHTTGAPFTATDVPAPQDIYAVSKWQAELMLQRICAGSAMQLVVIRPALVAGAGAPGNLARLAELVHRGIPLPLRAVRNRRSLVGVHSLAQLLAIACVHPGAAGGLFLAADEPSLSTAEIVEAIAGGMGVKARLVGIPPGVLKWTGRLLGLSRQVARLLESLEVDASAARAVLAWQPGRTIHAELRELGRCAPRA